MRVVITGASGNLGTSLLAALADEDRVTEVVGVARRVPTARFPKVTWRCADVTTDELEPLFEGADAVVHLVWTVQPNHDQAALRRVNVGGSSRVFQAVAAIGVPTLVTESAFGAYAGEAGRRAVDESWPTTGIPGSWYAQQKAEVERLLDGFEADHPAVRVVRFRSALCLKREAGAQAHRLYGGPLLPRFLVRPGRVPAVPDVPGARVQAVHSDDVALAYRLALTSDVRGAFNLAAEPVLDPSSVAAALGSRRLPMPRRLLRAVVDATWRARLQPTSPDWLDLMIDPPLLEASRARAELGWQPRHSATSALREFLAGVADGAGGLTPPLAPLAQARPSFRP